MEVFQEVKAKQRFPASILDLQACHTFLLEVSDSPINGFFTFFLGHI